MVANSATPKQMKMQSSVIHLNRLVGDLMPEIPKKMRANLARILTY